VLQELPFRLLASVFVDAQSLTPKPEVVREVLSILGDDNFVPVVAFETVDGRRTPRIALRSPQGLRITLAASATALS
jgi:hypothetical protein